MTMAEDAKEFFRKERVKENLETKRLLRETIHKIDILGLAKVKGAVALFISFEELLRLDLSTSLMKNLMDDINESLNYEDKSD